MAGREVGVDRVQLTEMLINPLSSQSLLQSNLISGSGSDTMVHQNMD